MKILAIMAVLIVALSYTVFAQTESESVGIEAGMTPDSPLYFLDEIGDSIHIMTAATKIAKIQARLDIAQEKLAEYELMVAAKKDTAAARSLAHQDKLVKDASDEEATLSDEDKVKVKDNFSKHLAVLQRVREKIRANNPDQASGLDRAIANAEEGRNVAEKAEADIEEKRKNAR